MGEEKGRGGGVTGGERYSGYPILCIFSSFMTPGEIAHRALSNFSCHLLTSIFLYYLDLSSCDLVILLRANFVLSFMILKIQILLNKLAEMRNCTGKQKKRPKTHITAPMRCRNKYVCVVYLSIYSKIPLIH